LQLLDSQNAEYVKLAVYSLRKFSSQNVSDNEGFRVDDRIIKALVEICMKSENKNTIVRLRLYIFMKK
jgi:hypothetical protein